MTSLFKFPAYVVKSSNSVRLSSYLCVELVSQRMLIVCEHKIPSGIAPVLKPHAQLTQVVRKKKKRKCLILVSAHLDLLWMVTITFLAGLLKVFT